MSPSGVFNGDETFDTSAWPLSRSGAASPVTVPGCHCRAAMAGRILHGQPRADRVGVAVLKGIRDSCLRKRSIVDRMVI